MRASMLRRLPAMIALFVALAWSGVESAKSADLFGHADQPAAVTETKQITLPAPLRPILAAVVEAQTKMNALMRAQLVKARDGQSLRPALIIVLFAFLYGVAHAVGPGHGKVVIGSYFLTRRARVAQGIAMSATAALVQALSAIVLVGLLAAVLELSSAAIIDQAATIETISYGIIVVIGLWMAYGVLTGRQHDHGHGHDHAHGHDHEHAKPKRSETWRMLATGAAVGLRPCSGAILVLLFCLANDIIWIGVIATFAMAMGVAITVAAVSLASLGVHRAAAAIGGRTKRIAETGYSVAALGGALLIALFGLLELVGVWTGALTPGAG